MKMLFVAHDDYFDITDTFVRAGCQSYLKLYKGTWPSGEANALFVPIPDEELPNLLKVLGELKAQYPTIGLRAFTFSLEECVF